VTTDAYSLTAQNKSKCLPTYLVLDTSSSMKDHEDLLNDLLEHVYDSLVASPRVSEFAHISIISFNTAPHVVLEMTDIEAVSALPLLACDGTTNYGAAFREVKARIDMDVDKLKAEGKAVLRPAVFLLTDGAPTDNDWSDAFATLVDRNWSRRPHVITFGFGAAHEAVLSKVSTKAAFLAESSSSQKEALSTVMSSLLHTLVASARREELQIPEKVPGFTSVPIEYVD